MYNTIEESIKMLEELLPLINEKDREVIVCPGFISLPEVSKLLSHTSIALGAQNMYFEDKGAYTGEVSPLFLKEIGVAYVILGHSERRHVLGENDALINKKVAAALRNGINPILCVGETLEEREKGFTFDIIKRQLTNGLTGLDDDLSEELVIAYEPVWAIGTGKTATKEDANLVIGQIRSLMADIYSHDIANNIRILYGGSVKPGNIKELMGMPEIDGALVGGASLKAKDFAEIINY